MSTEIQHPGHEDDPRAALVRRWAERHGIETAQRLAQAEDFADAVAEEITPENTVATYAKSWKVWQRFCATQNFPENEGSRGALVAFAAWLLREGRQSSDSSGVRGYAPNSATTHLSAVIVGLRDRGTEVSRDDSAKARAALDGLIVQILKAGERRGRGKAAAADIEGLEAVAASTPDTLAGARDLALILTSFHFAGRASEPAGLLNGDVVLHPRGLRVSVLTGKTKFSVREVAIPYAQNPAVCPVLAWRRWRERLVIEGGAQYADPTDTAFHAIDCWGHIGGAMAPASVSAAVARIAERAGVPIRWTGHSLRSGLATEARKKRKDAVAVAAQGGWAPNSKSMLGYMRRADEWDDNASAGLA